MEETQREQMKCFMGCEPDVNPQHQNEVQEAPSSPKRAPAHAPSGISQEGAGKLDNRREAGVALAQRQAPHRTAYPRADSDASMQMWSKMAEVN